MPAHPIWRQHHAQGAEMYERCESGVDAANGIIGCSTGGRRDANFARQTRDGRRQKQCERRQRVSVDSDGKRLQMRKRSAQSALLLPLLRL